MVEFMSQKLCAYFHCFDEKGSYAIFKRVTQSAQHRFSVSPCTQINNRGGYGSHHTQLGEPPQLTDLFRSTSQQQLFPF